MVTLTIQAMTDYDRKHWVEAMGGQWPSISTLQRIRADSVEDNLVSQVSQKCSRMKCFSQMILLCFAQSKFAQSSSPNVVVRPINVRPIQKK